MNLCDSLQCQWFLDRMAICESNTSALSNWEHKFVVDLREKFETREMALDLGMTAWSPTRNQWAALQEISERLKKEGRKA